MKPTPKAVKKPFEVERTDNAVLTLTFDGIGKGWEQWFLLTTDRHWDHPCSDRELQKQHLDLAAERNAYVFDAGDLFCAMQGRDDKRGSKSDVRNEHKDSRYFNALVDTAAKWFSPWAHRFVFISPGNHETAVIKRHELDLTSMLVTTLSSKANIERMTYAGWVRFMFRCRAGGRSRQSYTMFYHHGYGGGGPVTRGVIDTNRMAVYNDADICWTGHTHDEWIIPITRARLSDRGVPYLDRQVHVRTPGYKDEFSKYEGFHIEKGRGPKPLNAAWLQFYYLKDKVQFRITPVD